MNINIVINTKNCIKSWQHCNTCCCNNNIQSYLVIHSLAATYKKPARATTKVSKGANIRNRYNQVPHLTQDTNGKVTNSQLDTKAHKLFPNQLTTLPIAERSHGTIDPSHQAMKLLLFQLNQQVVYQIMQLIFYPIFNMTL